MLALALAALAIGVGVTGDRASPVGPALVAAEPKISSVSPEGADLILRDEPLTIVFRRSVPRGDFAGLWNWSINSAGDAEMTGSRRRQSTLTADQMAAIRRSLRAERFAAFKDSYGQFKLHGGYDTLTVIAGGAINKTVRFENVWDWPGEPRTMRESVPAARVWVTLVEILDPDEKVFRERKTLATALQILDRPADPKAADSPEQAVALLADAARAGDVDAFLAQLGAHTRAVFDMGRALKAVDAALDGRFGKEPDRDASPTMREMLDRFKARTHKVRDRAARGDKRMDLTVWVITADRDGTQSIQEEIWTTLKEGAGWKVVFPDKGLAKKAIRKDADGREVQVTVIDTGGYDPADSAEEEAQARAAARLLDEFARDVKAGKYATREKAEEALSAAKRRLREKGK